MNRNEFMERLEYLLADIPEEDKMDALAYYRDYLEEAGDRADEAIKEFGSPERIASIIRSDLAGNLEDGGTFTERGYEDERFRDPNFQVARRYDLPETPEEEWKKASGTGTSDRGGENRGSGNGGTDDSGRKKPFTSRPLKIVLWVILFFTAAPMLVGVGGVVTGTAVAVVGVLIGIIVFLAALTVALVLAALALCVVGIIAMLTWLPGGLLLFGSGVVVAGLAVLSLMASILFYGKFIPWLIRGVVDGISGLVHGRRKAG